MEPPILPVYSSILLFNSVKIIHFFCSREEKLKAARDKLDKFRKKRLNTNNELTTPGVVQPNPEPTTPGVVQSNPEPTSGALSKVPTNS